MTLYPLDHAAIMRCLTISFHAELQHRKCCDCPSLDASWASVNHGILLCLDCAGKHRSLGVQNSFIRSIYMDTWSQDQVEMMLQGGNRQLHEYFDKLKIEYSSLAIEKKLYQTRASAHYREKLRERVCFLALDKSLAGSPASTRRHSRSKIEKSPNGHISNVRSISGLFTEGPLGMTLSQGEDGTAYVSYVANHGCAEKSGILEGDVVVAISGRLVANYEDVMDSIPFVQRPMRIDFTRTEKVNNIPPLSRELSWQPMYSDESDNFSSENLENISLLRRDLNNVNIDCYSSTDVQKSLPLTPSSLRVGKIDFSGTDKGNVEEVTVELEQNESAENAVDDDQKVFVTVLFLSSPLGMTLTMNEVGSAEVKKLISGGHAENLGVNIGDGNFPLQSN